MQYSVMVILPALVIGGTWIKSLVGIRLHDELFSSWK